MGKSVKAKYELTVAPVRLDIPGSGHVDFMGMMFPPVPVSPAPNERICELKVVPLGEVKVTTTGQTPKSAGRAVVEVGRPSTGTIVAPVESISMPDIGRLVLEIDLPPVVRFGHSDWRSCQPCVGGPSRHGPPL